MKGKCKSLFLHLITASNSFQTAFNIIAAKSTDLHEIFSYPIISLPLIIASPDSSLYQSDKGTFRSYIMKSLNSVSSSFPQDAKSIIDRMVGMRFLKPK